MVNEFSNFANKMILKNLAFCNRNGKKEVAEILSAKINAKNNAGKSTDCLHLIGIMYR